MDMVRPPRRGSVAGSPRSATVVGSWSSAPTATSTTPAPPRVPPGQAPEGPAAPTRKPKRRPRERILRWAIVVVALVLVIVGSAYGYIRYRLGQIPSKHCATCVAAASGAPYNVLLVGSDTRAGDTGQAAKSFGSASVVTGQRSDTIKIIHIEPATGTARLLSIPRDTFVRLSDMPASSGLSTDNKINTAFNAGPDPLIRTIENTFGIPISHFVIFDFNGVIDLVNSVGGIKLNFPYPVRDNDNGNNNSGLVITHAGCQSLQGNMALALSRSRYYQYEVRPGYWQYDGSGDLGRIQRQNTVIEAVLNTARNSYNPLKINAFLGSIVHDVTKDDAMSSTAILSLAQQYHAFSGSQLQTFTLPTLGAYAGASGDVEVVQQPAAQQVLTQFLGTSPDSVVTPPLNAYGGPVTVPAATTTPTTSAPSHSGTPAPSPPVPGTGPFNPTPC